MKRGAPVPDDVRSQVLARDHNLCRICGRYDDQLALHHVDYRSQGGENTVDNLICLGWLPSRDCHLTVVHARKDIWQPICHVLITIPALTGLQVIRQLAEGIDPRAFGLDVEVAEKAKAEYARLLARRRA